MLCPYFDQHDQIEFVYGNEIMTHYVMEAKIPLTALGITDLSTNPLKKNYDIWLHWTMECGNDYFNLKGDINPIPEPTTLLLFTAGLPLLAGKMRRKKTA